MELTVQDADCNPRLFRPDPALRFGWGLLGRSESVKQRGTTGRRRRVASRRKLAVFRSAFALKLAFDAAPANSSARECYPMHSYMSSTASLVTLVFAV